MKNNTKLVLAFTGTYAGFLLTSLLVFPSWHTSKRNKILIEAQRTYDSLYNQVFGTNGVADVNHDEKFSPLELFNALDATGKLQIGLDGNSFYVPELTTDDLKRVIDSYKK